MGVQDNLKGSKKGGKCAQKRPNSALVENSDNTSKTSKHEESNGKAADSAKDKKPTCQQQRKGLPVYRLRKRLLEEIKKNKTLIIVGETGSGKSTQIPQLLLNSGIAGATGCIGITAPRRIAAMSVARRVAQEMSVVPGKLVGYSVPFEDLTSTVTRIKYLTDEMMLREAMTDEVLSEYSVVILDEAHERSVQTDVLLGVARRAQQLRTHKKLPPLKLIVMSATMDVDKFTTYFQAPAIYIEGRQHPVKIYHGKKSQDDYCLSVLATAFKVHRESPPNEDILVFLTGQEEIEAAATAARLAAKQLEGRGYPPLKVYPLYAALTSHQQLEAFKPSPPGMRKLVLASNIAETSVTISGIRTVIDSGVVKERTHDPTTGLDVLRVGQISKAQAWQRTGRAGREGPGVCYRIYTSEEFDKMKEMPVAEIQSCSLAGVALQLLAIGIDISTFDFMDKPPEDAINTAVACLEKLAAVKASPPQLTTLGRTMSLFPLDPRLAKVILASVEHKCLDEALTVVALSSGENIFVDNPTKREEVVASRSRFVSEEGDHVTLLNVYRAYVNAPQKKNWCHENHIHHRNLTFAVNIRQQLAAITERAKLKKSCCGKNTEALRKALMAGLGENMAELQRDEAYVTLSTKQPVAIHPSSVLHGLKPQLVLFTEVVLTGKCYIRGLSTVDPTWLKEKAGSAKVE